MSSQNTTPLESRLIKNKDESNRNRLDSKLPKPETEKKKKKNPKRTERISPSLDGLGHEPGSSVTLLRKL